MAIAASDNVLSHGPETRPETTWQARVGIVPPVVSTTCSACKCDRGNAKINKTGEPFSKPGSPATMPGGPATKAGGPATKAGEPPTQSGPNPLTNSG
eukprot:4773433-Amphidinium_carterae.1